MFGVVIMAKRITNNIITGNDPCLGMCFYYSPHFDLNIWRRASSLTGERTKKDPAFKGFRQSSNRLKEASPIAASLYKMLPGKIKRYALYRTLTGEAIKMLKEGAVEGIISESLKKKYIDPLLETPEKYLGNRTVNETVPGERVKGMTDFTSYPPLPEGVRKITRSLRASLLQKITKDHSTAEDFSSSYSEFVPATGRNISESLTNEPVPLNEPKKKDKTTSDLIFLGRLPECKKLKMWLRPVNSSGLGSIRS